MLELNSAYDGAHCDLGYVLLAEEKPDAALTLTSEEPDKDTRASCMTDVLWVLGRRMESDTLLAAVKAKYASSGAIQIAASYALRNDKNDAFEWLDRSYENGEPSLTTIGFNPSFRSLRDDPRYTALLRKMNIGQ